MTLPSIVVDQPTYRLIPSRFPPIQTFEAVTSQEDMEAVMELEGWTNDRLVVERLHRLPKDQWVYGIPCASIIMASFIHVAPEGTRFNNGQLGAWYASLTLKAAIAEIGHHLRREAINTNRDEMVLEYRTYAARLKGDYIDIRGCQPTHPDLYHPSSYGASQAFGEDVRAGDKAGIAFDSVRLVGGQNVVAYRPRYIEDVVQGDHYQVNVPIDGKIVARKKSGK